MENSIVSREVNRKFMLTLPSHLEHKISSIRERDDINEMSIERLYGKLKTHEMGAGAETNHLWSRVSGQQEHSFVEDYSSCS